MANGDEIKITKVSKKVNPNYKVKDEYVENAIIKAFKNDAGGDFYVFDLYNADKNILALNRYTHENNSQELPFTILTKTEKEILNPIIINDDNENKIRRLVI